NLREGLGGICSRGYEIDGVKLDFAAFLGLEAVLMRLDVGLQVFVGVGDFIIAHPGVGHVDIGGVGRAHAVHAGVPGHEIGRVDALVEQGGIFGLDAVFLDKAFE